MPLGNPVSRYISFWDKRLGPRAPTHYLTETIKIKKGERTGEIIVPCPIQIVQHTYDLNPSLIKRTKKPVHVMTNIKTSSGDTLMLQKEEVTKTELPLNVPFMFHPDQGEEVVLEKNEHFDSKEDVERCPHCGQKAVIATVGETKGPRGIHFNIDPVLSVTLSDPATEDLEIPIQFGIWPKTIKQRWHMGLALCGMFIALPILMLVPNFLLPPFPGTTPAAIESARLTAILGVPLIWSMLAVIAPILLLPGYKGWKWLKSVKSQLQPIPKEFQSI